VVDLCPLVTPGPKHRVAFSHLQSNYLQAGLWDFAEPFPAASNTNYVHYVTSSTHDCLFWPVTESGAVPHLKILKSLEAS